MRSEKVGRVRTCAIEPGALSQAEQWINARRMEWEHRLDRLGEYLKTLEPKEIVMAQMIEAKKDAAVRQPPPLRFSRIFDTRRETVFKAWSSTDHVKRWFSPETFTVSDAKVQMHIGGPFDVCMRSPAGEEHWTRGTFIEVTPHTRLVIDMHVTDSAGEPLFRAYTEVDLSDALGGTRMDVARREFGQELQLHSNDAKQLDPLPANGH